MASMSTPISQIMSNPNFHNSTSDCSGLDDMTVAGVINEMEQDMRQRAPIAQPVATNVATFHHNPVKQNNMTIAVALQWNPDDFKTAIILAVLALVLFSPLLDSSILYEKIPALEALKPYDFYIRGVVVTFVFYVVLRMFLKG